MYVIINISGKQFKAFEGTKIRVPKQNGEVGSSLTFDEVLLLSNDNSTQIGNPYVKGSSVTATILDQGRDKKIIVYKKKRRKGYQRKNGHRQFYTEIEIKKINASKSKVKTTSSKNLESVSDDAKTEEE